LFILTIGVLPTVSRIFAGQPPIFHIVTSLFFPFRQAKNQSQLQLAEEGRSTALE
jgi:hypothetical protein